MNIATATVEHLRELLVVVERLADEGISILSHECSYLSFGSFVVECAVGHRQARFSWDGKDSILVVEYRTVTNQNSVAPWTHDSYVKSSSSNVLAEIGTNARRVLR